MLLLKGISFRPALSIERLGRATPITYRFGSETLALDKHALKGIAFNIYKLAIKTELAQLGIKPIIIENKGDKYLLFVKKLITFSSPI